MESRALYLSSGPLHWFGGSPHSPDKAASALGAPLQDSVKTMQVKALYQLTCVAFLKCLFLKISSLDGVLQDNFALWPHLLYLVAPNHAFNKSDDFSNLRNSLNIAIRYIIT